MWVKSRTGTSNFRLLWFQLMLGICKDDDALMSFASHSMWSTVSEVNRSFCHGIYDIWWYRNVTTWDNKLYYRFLSGVSRSFPPPSTHTFFFFFFLSRIPAGFLGKQKQTNNSKCLRTKTKLLDIGKINPYPPKNQANIGKTSKKT